MSTAIRVWCGVLAVVMAASGQGDSKDPTRRVEVHVTVTTNGAPFPAGIYIIMGMKGEIPQKFIDAPIDENGRAALIADYPAATETIGISIPGSNWWTRSSETQERDATATAAERAFSLPTPRFIALRPGQEVYTIDLHIPEAVTVSGRVVDENHQPVSVGAHRSGWSSHYNRNVAHGSFEVVGVPKGEDSFIFLMTTHLEKIVYKLTSERTQHDLDLGVISIGPELIPNASIDIVAKQRDTVRDDAGLQYYYVSLIHEHGQYVYLLKLTEEDKLSHLLTSQFPSPPRVRDGRYYIAPGNFHTSDSTLKALRLIHNDQRALLDAAGVPAIDAVPGQVTAGAIDLAAAQQAIDVIPE